ncbi:MAG: hypothetical protein F6K00_07385 [Leptolyngbya sp. SIOISBB]|nr:hypothetical protein [Leptolyngbya sp. SIOISBB]
MNNRRSLQIHRCLLAIAITMLLANTYPQSQGTSGIIDSFGKRSVTLVSSESQ